MGRPRRAAAPIDAEPPVGAHQRRGIEAADVRPPAHLAAHQPGAFEHLDMLRRGGERHGERLGEFADAARPAGEFAEHRAPRRIAERMEDRVEGVRIMFNHMV
jgi:hypothetical protein